MRDKAELCLIPTCYESKSLELDSEVTLYRVYIRELNRELCTGLSTLYTNT